MVIQKVYRAWDTLYSEKEHAEKMVEGWEHKESVIPFHALVSSPNQYSYDYVESLTHKTYEQAKEELEYE